MPILPAPPRALSRLRTDLGAKADLWQGREINGSRQGFPPDFDSDSGDELTVHGATVSRVVQREAEVAVQRSPLCVWQEQSGFLGKANEPGRANDHGGGQRHIDKRAWSSIVLQKRELHFRGQCDAIVQLPVRHLVLLQHEQAV